MKAFVLMGTPEEIVTAIAGLRDQGIITPGSATVVDSSGMIEAVALQPKELAKNANGRKRQLTIKETDDKEFCTAGSIYERLINMYNSICTKLTPRKKTVNRSLKKDIDALFRKSNPISMEMIEEAFHRYQDGQWFDDERTRKAYGTFAWCIQRTKIENALKGKYSNRIFNVYNNTHYGKEVERIDRQRLGRSGVKSTGADF